MNIQVDLKLIELAQLKAKANQLIGELLSLSDPNDTVITIDGGSIKTEFIGRGMSIIQIELPKEYSAPTRINYLQGTIKELTKTRNYILETKD